MGQSRKYRQRLAHWSVRVGNTANSSRLARLKSPVHAQVCFVTGWASMNYYSTKGHSADICSMRAGLETARLLFAVAGRELTPPGHSRMSNHVDIHSRLFIPSWHILRKIKQQIIFTWMPLTMQ
jgi:hypothetical protein